MGSANARSAGLKEVRIMIRSVIPCVMATVLLVGCEETGQSTARPKPPAPPVPATKQEATSPMKTERVKAQVGVGRSGRRLEDEKLVKMIVAPARAYFRARERVTFDIKIPKALQIYKALNNNVGPQSHEEFMEKIIRANHIDLPTLLEGHRYVYDPKREELMVERPAQ
jgi:hypothetical protein